MLFTPGGKRIVRMLVQLAKEELPIVRVESLAILKEIGLMIPIPQLKALSPISVTRPPEKKTFVNEAQFIKEAE